MASKIRSAAVIGLDALPVETEADVAPGFPNFTVVGLPDAAVQESRVRVKAAIRSSGLPFPDTRLTVNLAPADIKKEGPAYDLPIAVAILAAAGVLEPSAVEKRLFIGELALDGAIRPVAGALPIALMAVERGFGELYVPEANAAEAALAARQENNEERRLVVYAVSSLPSLVRHLRREEPIAPLDPAAIMPAASEDATAEAADLAFVKGQLPARRALEIAAAGGHNILLNGPPGSGKTMLARTLPGILPPLSWNETLEVTRIYSAAGLTCRGRIIDRRPFRCPHHTASGVALIGGGAWPKPGEVSLAHRGVLFLDEFPEFSRAVLENLRQPLEDGCVTVSRASGSLRFPAKFMLIAAQNPCPCGYSTDPDAVCTCAPSQILKYRKRISGPLLDRIDLHVEVPKIKTPDLFTEHASETSAVVRARVEAARARQAARLAGTGAFTNAEMGQRLMKKFCRLDEGPTALLRTAAEKMKLSARAVSRTIKVARTIADLAGEAEIAAPHVAEALQFRERRG